MAEAFLYGGGGSLKSAIIVSAPTGSTVTCSNGALTKTTQEQDGTWIFRGLDLGTWTVTAALDGQTTSQTVTFDRLEVEYINLAYASIPTFTYTGDYELVQDDDTPIENPATYKGDWKLRLLTSGTLTITKMNGFDGSVDVFLVGGGGNGSCVAAYEGETGGGQGGGGGYTSTQKAVSIITDTEYEIEIGGATGTSSAFGHSAAGGENGGDGGDGGSGGAAQATSTPYGSLAGGSDGENGANGQYGAAISHGGYGQIEQPGPNGETGNTREFGEETGKLYSGGGAGGQRNSGAIFSGGDGGGGDTGTSGEANTGGGGGGAPVNQTTGSGGSGIVIIRNHREEAA